MNSPVVDMENSSVFATLCGTFSLSLSFRLWREKIMCPPSLAHNSITSDGFHCHICLFYQASGGSVLLLCNQLSFWKVLGLGFSTCSGIWTIHTLHYQGCQAQRSQGTTRRLIHDRLLQDIWRRHFCLARKVWRERGKKLPWSNIVQLSFPLWSQSKWGRIYKVSFWKSRTRFKGTQWSFSTLVMLWSEWCFDEWVPIVFVSCDQQTCRLHNKKFLLMVCRFSTDWQLVAVTSPQNVATCQLM